MGMLKWTKAAQLSFSPLLPATGQEERKGRKAISYMYSLGNYTYTHMASFFSSKKFRIFFFQEGLDKLEGSCGQKGGLLEISKGKGGMLEVSKGKEEC